MNKYKKIAAAVVSTVMAGTMAFSFAACAPEGGDGGDPSHTTHTPDSTTTWHNDSSTHWHTCVEGGEKLQEAQHFYDDAEDEYCNVCNYHRTITPGPGPGPGTDLPEDLTPQTDGNGKLSYTANMTLKTYVGYEKVATGITFGSDQIATLGGAGASEAIFGGVKYVSGNLKPAWRALANQLKVTISDDWVAGGGPKASKVIETLKTAQTLGNYGIITASASEIVKESANDSFLNITDYLDYMPNYKAFLEANPIVRLSLVADAWKGEVDEPNENYGAMYMLPYFDGNDDIEKYVLIRKDLVRDVLDASDVAAATGTFSAQATAKNAYEKKGVVTVDGSQSSVKSFMGKTGSWTIKVTDPTVVTTGPNGEGTKVADADKMKTVELTVDYDAVIEALGTDSALATAVKAAGSGSVISDLTALTTTDGTKSGNIVDIMNYMIDETTGSVTGAQLIKVLQEYIKVAYYQTGHKGTPFYDGTTHKLSDIFNSAYAAWDVDLYVALGRCLICSNDLLTEDVRAAEQTYMLGSRTGFTNRTYDIASMAGELYGVRGLTSRYANLYTYIDSEGEIHDARNDEEMWAALANMNAMAKEGIYYTGTEALDGGASIKDSTVNTNQLQFYSSTDYVQTQTKNAIINADKVGVGYEYAPILTAVSKWDVDGDGEHDDIMRFTESWRGVKDGGFCVPKAYVRGNAERLSAVLAFIDYFYSNDGQILMTFGPQSTAGDVTVTGTSGKTVNDTYGTWYGTAVAENIGGASPTNLEALKEAGVIDTYDNEQYFVTEEYEGQAFMYKNKLYTGTYYKGKMTPTLTTENLDMFKNGSKGNFTNHARYLLGSCLNLGVKDQSFEYQCTATCGLGGSDIVAIALVNETIKHTKPVMDSENWWYTLPTTLLPFDTDTINALKDGGLQYISGMGGSGKNFFYADKNNASNLLTDIMYYGFDQTKQISVVSDLNKNIPGTAAGVIEMLNSNYGGNNNNLSTLEGYIKEAWADLVGYWDEIKPAV